MAKTRRQSFACVRKPKQQDDHSLSTHAVTLTPALDTLTTSKKGNASFSHIDALTNMTIELNMRALGHQAAQLDKDLQALVRQTQEDKAYRAQHESHISEIWKEVLAVQARVSEVSGGQESIKERYEEYRRDALDSIDKFRRDMGDMKELCTSLSTQLDSLPTMADLDLVASQSLQPMSQPSQDVKRINTSTDLPGDDSNPSLSSGLQVQQRIDETIASTRRWNREFKVTDLPEAKFIARYLQKQSKRDPKMALHIQRAIRTRVRDRYADKPRPTNLEKFCEFVKWNDVLTTVQQVLGKDRKATIAAI